mmetsp:Transcript_2866/g.6503  ORF Transcript_2866/g.6503 Transcript_2866/m.6503 type:complete len:200 (+) Transcript_2866:1689-2288(+)
MRTQVPRRARKRTKIRRLCEQSKGRIRKAKMTAWLLLWVFLQEYILALCILSGTSNAGSMSVARAAWMWWRLRLSKCAMSSCALPKRVRNFMGRLWLVWLLCDVAACVKLNQLATMSSCEGCDCVSRGDRVCCGSGFARTQVWASSPILKWSPVQSPPWRPRPSLKGKMCRHQPPLRHQQPPQHQEFQRLHCRSGSLKP